MAKGKTHDLFNSILGLFFTASLVHFQYSIAHILGFSFGWLLSTLVLGPDLDIAPKKRSGYFLQLLLYPYSIFSKHRGRSHWPIWGTLGRFVYLVLVSFLIVFVLYKMQWLQSPPHEHFWQGFLWLGRHIWQQTIAGQFAVATALGLLLADLGHITLDRLSSMLK